ncbi:hypothetical protein EYF80_041634 [Liparis tanakae]|uniref:Uncharacterized protein n=1 Tax=Liparis tanakae TaxID=230148 RepID=A0A4Z2G5W9_9TELE|nr:hypothetical protein EYF80_041634 [Liparis tanakae]
MEIESDGECVENILAASETCEKIEVNTRFEGKKRRCALTWQHPPALKTRPMQSLPVWNVDYTRGLEAVWGGLDALQSFTREKNQSSPTSDSSHSRTRRRNVKWSTYPDFVVACHSDQRLDVELLQVADTLLHVTGHSFWFWTRSSESST